MSAFWPWPIGCPKCNRPAILQAVFFSTTHVSLSLFCEPCGQELWWRDTYIHISQRCRKFGLDKPTPPPTFTEQDIQELKGMHIRLDE